jgi:hypothetical protein
MFHRSKHHAPSRLRRYVVVFVGAALAAGLGIAAATSWTVVPQGHGNAYGKGKPKVTGVAISTMDWSSGQNTVAIGPSESGVVVLGMENNNPFNVTLDSVVVPVGANITAVGDPTCVATQGTDFTVGATHIDNTNITAFQNNQGTVIDVTTSATFPICLADAVFKLPIDINAHKAAS